MIVMGIDPGVAITGCAVVSEKNGKQTLLYSHAVITLPRDTLQKRLSTIYREITEILLIHRPDIAVLENLFFNTNAKTAFLVGQSRGVIQLALFQNNIGVTEYTPLQVKMAMTGYGRADKNQIQILVKQILKLPEILSPDDVADAAAIALTHCFSYKMKSNINDRLS
ncbi:crossover junction endodeoxyribonuclease RuvC [Candidatus Gottesmanbacteria bacterium RIFCSPHIGHO2_02_FULL_40_24]|uniref:Crossover junction endodeoxyribonuclease RuvC n=1 Tax=Candidatus Gottesmanbacteria bacterium RIFCSPHIGHO2_01_FULL_40_15 TaxID=1798376 RepID=A0A1F5Z018_9BACT|nr:MAG: crossover junction endodeoxyribonuclease RuvC [Candidatus Gottesmanbacteria bacterium RIFCSPHIGHO2_01_FULL_40_15]OGG18599.1 MAG: crossover junction endodeoxyribonuclease RuvC [Candidatus Gottesmanbacteria bacterium RIFCSPHIGHO2_02_FULL_40_24]OGG22850.1 MAG: crossover junction endodeoxyribonuclease RuvC [Candidatus Gottesmanbacteria bacterium RIFCSPLOWO2_01_FULL_40_10]OGG24914.1 MAG: crossover junction endodeoxyribonuclease RuvC [Candidatus Gottesmanbacteria bacterium RIFCSPHIGHO2_12_FULL